MTHTAATTKRALIDALIEYEKCVPRTHRERIEAIQIVRMLITTRA